jgi:hypothetical protein
VPIAEYWRNLLFFRTTNLWNIIQNAKGGPKWIKQFALGADRESWKKCRLILNMYGSIHPTWKIGVAYLAGTSSLDIPMK